MICFSHGRGQCLIYVSKQQLDQVEYLIEQSKHGNHVLFDHKTIRKIFEKSVWISDEDAYSVEHHIERLILQPTLEEKKAYLEKLDSDTFSKVVRTYFNIVENNLYESREVTH